MSPNELRQATTSLIAVLHERYEAVEAACQIAEAEQPCVDEDSTRHYALERAMQDLSNESDLIRRLILLQPPGDDADLTLMSYHTWLLVDAIDSVETPDKEDRAALQRGVQHIFNYLVGAGRVEMEKIGKNFSYGAALAFRAEQDRCGEPKDSLA